MTIFIIFRQQRTLGRFAGNRAPLHAAEITLSSRLALHSMLHFDVHRYLGLFTLAQMNKEKSTK